MWGWCPGFEATDDSAQLIRQDEGISCVREILDFIFKGAKAFNEADDFCLLIDMDHTGCTVGKKRLWMRTCLDAGVFLTAIAMVEWEVVRAGDSGDKKEEKDLGNIS